MISVLIPTHNYNVYPLAKQVSDQCVAEGILHEIIVMDDASDGYLAENQKINSLPDASFSVLPENIGRSKIRNLLASRATHDWLLFLDADTMPVLDNFISRYLSEAGKGPAAINGGILYQPQKPDTPHLLRWTYGKLREALPLKKRVLNPYRAFLSLNFLIWKPYFDAVGFDAALPNLRHEDTVFSYDLQQAGIPVRHIENPVCHLGIDRFETALEKEHNSLLALKKLLLQKRLPPNYIRIAQLYSILEKTGLCQAVKTVFQWWKPRLLKNLSSDKPGMRAFDLYRIGYLCSV